ncbi:IS1096 element passenger TnpR family protein [Tenacibaculum sp. 190524A05c]|uniref:IS1096 element passenger TnpR family protein n=1 Tax=Tenacibaculum platacis TaxID=3137852 RepID=UPI0031FB7AED
MYKVRAILDVEEDVIRTIMFDENLSLEKLHFDIANAFGLEGNEMASFYKSDDEWNQGLEIPLFNMAEAGEELSMASCTTKDILENKNDKLIYVYDFLQMWTFYIELIESSEEAVAETKTILSVGEMPKDAPEKVFESDQLLSDFDDENRDMFNDFEDLDSLDLDNY